MTSKNADRKRGLQTPDNESLLVKAFIAVRL